MRQENVQVAAPGFLGLNSEEAPTNLEPGWCAIADNAVIDSSGRIASRKGYRILTADNTNLGSAEVQGLHEANYTDGTTKWFAVGNNKIWDVNHTTGVFTDITPGGVTITSDVWDIITVNDDTLFVQAGEEPLVYDKSASSITVISGHANYNTTHPEASVALAAYGRSWLAGVDGERGTIYWSDLLIPVDFDGGTSGSLDLTTVWPNGGDEVRAIAAHNNKLIVFGREAVLIFGSSNSDGKLGDPAADLFLEDTILDVGCVGKDAWAVIGSDLWFVDYTGFRSLGRTIQEKSLPIGDISKNVNTNFRNGARTEDGTTRVMYSPDDAVCLVIFPTQGLIWCWDTRQRMQDGSARATQWVGLPFQCGDVSRDGTMYFADNNGISRYTGYLDAAAGDGTGGTKFRFRYYPHPQTFGAPANLKVPKEVDFVIGGGLGQRAVCYWGYGYGNKYINQPFTLNSETPDFYNIDEFNITTTDDPDDPTEYGSGSTIGQYSIHLSGSGAALVVGLEANVLGQKLSLQEMNIQTKIGRTI